MISYEKKQDERLGYGHGIHVPRSASVDESSK
jgi:hypothetical protein